MPRSIKYYILFILFSFKLNGQIANYVANGGFEDYRTCSLPNDIFLVKNWRSTDSLGISSFYFSTCLGINNIPLNGYTFQYPRNGDAYFGIPFLCNPCISSYDRSYIRNRLKGNLQAGKTYCVKFYLNITNNSSYGMDSFGAYFSDNTLDTITKNTIPLTYLTPQIQNSVGNIITDTLNWVLITGTMVANGFEKNMLIGNFKLPANTNSILINPGWLPSIATDVLIDDVSCIDIDLAAYAGPDVSCIPGNSVYIGRQRDVGIDEACTWYKLPNNITPIGVAAGLTVSPVTTSTYMVRQDICGIIKYDTVVVHQTALGLDELRFKSANIKVGPSPASDYLNISFDLGEIAEEFTGAEILNSIGQSLRKEELVFKNKSANLKIADLPFGVYILSVKNVQNYSISRRFVIAR